MTPELDALRTGIESVLALDLGTVPTTRLPALAAEACRLADVVKAAAARWLDEAERQGALAASGELSGAHFLAKATGTSLKTARADTALGATLNQAPLLAAAVTDGALSRESAAVVGSVVDHPAFADHGDVLIEAVKGAGPRAARAAVDQWRHQHADAVDAAAEEAAIQAKLFVSLTPRPDGLVDLAGVLTSLQARAVEKALTHRTRSLPRNDGGTLAQRKATALADICEQYGAGELDGNREVPTVLVVASYETVFERAGRPGYASTGEVLTPEVIRRLCCDAKLHRLFVEAESTVLDFGRAVRSAPLDHWLALVARDGGCRWKDCDEPPERCEVHHEPPWEENGVTDVSRQVLLCKHGHHRKRHEPGWSATLHPDGAYTVTGPDGRTLTTRPRGLDRLQRPSLFGEEAA